MSSSLVTIRNIQEANLALRPFVPLVAQLTGKHTTLERIQPLMALLGNPQDKLKVVHIAGTSGKTSTAYFLSALLSSTGKKVGTTISPHIDSVTERVQINLIPLNDLTFCKELGKFLQIIEKAPQTPSYFELLYAFSVWVFLRQGVDYAVIETGMGGLYDATNVVTRSDKVCVITDIGLDHTHILGTTLPEIAAQKIGIVHEHNEVFVYDQDRAIMAVFNDWTNKHHAKLHITTEANERASLQLDVRSIPKYQQRNWLLAHRVFEYLVQRDGIRNLTSKELEKSIHIQVPGRMDIAHIGNKTIIMDGAHNLQKISALIASFQDLYPNKRPVVLIALKQDKDFKEVASVVSKIAERVIVTTFRSSQDLPVRSMDPRQLAGAFDSDIPVVVITDPQAALDNMLSSSGSLGIITGSFYLLSQIRNNNLL